MTQHISRKELKKDEVRETLAHGAEAVLTHRKLVAYLAVVTALVLAAIFGWRLYSERQTLRASAAFDDAMKVFDARIRAAGEPAEPGEVTFVQEKNKYEDAAKKFGKVAQRYPRTRPGQLARYYAALSLERLGRDGEAAKSLTEIASGSTPDFAALAKFVLAKLEDRTGKSQDAVRLFQELIANPSVLVPKAVVQIALANHYRQSDPAQAAKLYNQIKKENPDSAIAQQAEQQLSLLPGQS